MAYTADTEQLALTYQPAFQPMSMCAWKEGRTVPGVVLPVLQVLWGEEKKDGEVLPSRTSLSSLAAQGHPVLQGSFALLQVSSAFLTLRLKNSLPVGLLSKVDSCASRQLSSAWLTACLFQELFFKVVTNQPGYSSASLPAIKLSKEPYRLLK